MAISAEASANFEKHDLSQPLYFFLFCFFFDDRLFDTAIAAPLKGARPDLLRKATTGRAICGLWYAVCGMWSVAWSLTLDDRNM